MSGFTGWRTSSRSQGNGQCVEVGLGRERVAVRDTKNRAQGHFTVASEQWFEFVTRVKRGELDS